MWFWQKKDVEIVSGNIIKPDLAMIKVFVSLGTANEKIATLQSYVESISENLLV